MSDAQRSPITVKHVHDRWINRRTGDVTMYAAENIHTSTATVYFDGRVYRWMSNDQIPPADAIVHYAIDKLPHYDVALTDAVRDAETAAFVAEYRKRQAAAGPPSGEQLAEMRNAFGEGAVVVDVISGRRVQL
jgi:hypothetical protein